MEELSVKLKEAREFRKKLIDRMNSLSSKEINCMNCSGVCCTKSRNSMMVTPTEALELYLNLMSKVKDFDELWKRVNQSIIDFGLDREIYIKNKLMRKNYTCPLFKFESYGCPLDFNSKPFGCLGYNPKAKGVSEGEDCGSDVVLLEEVDLKIHRSLEKINEFLRTEYLLDFDKLSIPKALVLVHARTPV